MDENKPRRRWLSFGIRDLLWTMAVVALLSGWWSEYPRRAKLIKENQELRYALQQEGMKNLGLEIDMGLMRANPNYPSWHDAPAK